MIYVILNAKDFPDLREVDYVCSIVDHGSQKVTFNDQQQTDCTAGQIACFDNSLSILDSLIWVVSFWGFTTLSPLFFYQLGISKKQLKVADFKSKIEQIINYLKVPVQVR